MEETAQYNSGAKKKMAKEQVIQNVTIVSGALVLVALGFVGGMLYEKHENTAVATAIGTVQTGSLSVSGGATTRAGSMGGGVVTRGLYANEGTSLFGAVSAVSASSITIQEGPNANLKTVALSGNTTVENNGKKASVSDIAVGDSVMIVLSTSGNAAAQVIINPGGGTTSIQAYPDGSGTMMFNGSSELQ